MQLSLKQLRYMDALGRARHFGRAARLCFVTQPALSQGIKDLESALGTALVDRTSRKVLFTAEGELVVARARDILQSVDELIGSMQASRGPLGGLLRLGVIPTVAPYLLPALVQAIHVAYPTLEVRPREAITDRLVDDVLEGRLDLAVVAVPVDQPGLSSVFMFDEDFLLVREQMDGDKPVPDAAELEQMKLLLLEEGHCLRDQALSFCTTTGAQPRDVMEGSSLSTLVQMVGAGLGVTVIPEMAVKLETRTADVAVSRFPDPAPHRSLGLVWRKGNPLSDQLAGLADLLTPSSRALPSPS